MTKAIIHNPRNYRRRSLFACVARTFMPDGVETDGVAGYNPFGYNFGFIYHGAGERTIAHELGHGIASLHHPFNEQSFEKGNTANLMDYNFAEELYHFQWDNIQNPPSRIFKWNFEEEGAEAYRNNSHYICLSETYVNKLKESGYRYYYLPDGKVADYKDYRPSGFYTKEDGTSKTSYGAVATIKDGLGYDYYFIYGYSDKTNAENSHTNKGYGYITEIESNNDNILNQKSSISTLVYPITEIEETTGINPIRVQYNSENKQVLIIDNNNNILDTYTDATCDCNMAKFKPEDIAYKILNSTENSVLVYVPLENKVVIITTDYSVDKVLKLSDKKTITISELVKKGATYEELDNYKFANSKYNSIRTDVQKTMNEAGKYVTIGLGITMAAPYLLSTAVAEETSKNFAVGFISDFVSNSIANCIAYLIIEKLTFNDETQKNGVGEDSKILLDYFDWTEMVADASIAGVKNFIVVRDNF
ncbi:MAG: hypothetical protein MJ211_15605 [Bacteroidales bacterium]|nr:hypothetical protein [Bacteroidales bacterium]